MHSLLNKAIAAFVVAASLVSPLTGRAADAPVVTEQSVVASIPVALLQQIAELGAPDSHGAVSFNRDGWQRVDYQRTSALWAQYGIAAHDPNAVATALRIASFAFAHQQPDGGFAVAGDQSNAVGAAAWFVNDFAHTVALLAKNGWFQESPDTASSRTRLQNEMAHLSAALNYLVANRDTLTADTGAVNRTFMYANTFVIAGHVTGNSSAVRIGNGFLQNALDRQADDGTFTEAQGFDSSYQCVSLYAAQVLLVNLPAGNPLRDRLWSAIERGMTREGQALLPNGEISTSNNTRVGANSIPAMRGGTVHQVDRVHAALAFEYFAAISQRPGAQRAAARVAAHYWGL